MKDYQISLMDGDPHNFKEMISHLYQLNELMFSKKACIKHHAEARFEDLMKGEFYNFAMKKDLPVRRGCSIRKRVTHFHFTS